MRPFMYFKILTSRKHFSTAMKRTRERFLASMHPNMINKFIFRLKRTSIPRTVLPKACMRCTLRSTDMFNSQMCHNLVHTCEMFTANLPLCRRLIRIDPQTLHLLFDRLSHVSEEGAMHGGRRIRRMMGRHAHMGRIQILVVVRLRVMVSGGRMMVRRSRIQHLVMGRQMGMLVRRHLTVMMEQYRITGRCLCRRKVVMVAAQQKVSGRVAGVRVQMAHVAVVRLEVMILGALGGGHRSRRILVRRWDRGTATIVTGAHFDAVRRQVVVTTVHERIYHFGWFFGKKRTKSQNSLVSFKQFLFTKFFGIHSSSQLQNTKV